MVEGILAREVKKAEFKVGELFECKLGTQVKDIKPSGNIPVITGNTSANGVAGYVNQWEDESFVFNDGITVAMRGKGGTSYYQPSTFLLGHNSMVLKPKCEMNSGVKLYISIVLNKQASDRYNIYPTLKDYPFTVMYLPVAEDGTPDWDYMNDYMIAIQKKHLDQVESYNKRNELILKKAHPELDTQGGLEEPEGGFREFLIGEVFDLTSTNSGIDKNKILYGDKNLVPYVTRSEFNNGIAMMIPKEQNAKYEVNKGNCIAIGLDTQTAAYQETEFHTGQNVHVLRHPKMKKSNAQYIIANIKKVMQRFNWGGNGATLGRLSKETITLPATEDGTPDWGYMESFMNVVFERERERVRSYITAKRRQFCAS